MDGGWFLGETDSGQYKRRSSHIENNFPFFMLKIIMIPVQKHWSLATENHIKTTV